MAGGTKASTNTTRNTGMAYTDGLMADCMTAHGSMENNTAKANSLTLKATPKLAFGRMANARSG